MIAHTTDVGEPDSLLTVPHLCNDVVNFCHSDMVSLMILLSSGNDQYDRLIVVAIRSFEPIRLAGLRVLRVGSRICVHRKISSRKFSGQQDFPLKVESAPV